MKTYVLDASALISFLQEGPGADKVNEILRASAQGRATSLMSAVNYGEVYGKLLRDHGPEAALAAVQALSPLPIRLVDATPQRACKAADVKTKYELYYADSFAAALAIEHKATLVTGDSDFKKLGHGLSVVWLKN